MALDWLFENVIRKGRISRKAIMLKGHNIPKNPALIFENIYSFYQRVKFEIKDETSKLISVFLQINTHLVIQNSIWIEIIMKKIEYSKIFYDSIIWNCVAFSILSKLVNSLELFGLNLTKYKAVIVTDGASVMTKLVNSVIQKISFA